MLVAQAFVTDIDMVIEGATITFREALIGYLLAITLGVIVATTMKFYLKYLSVVYIYMLFYYKL